MGIQSIHEKTESCFVIHEDDGRVQTTMEQYLQLLYI